MLNLFRMFLLYLDLASKLFPLVNVVIAFLLDLRFFPWRGCCHFFGQWWRSWTACWNLKPSVGGRTLVWIELLSLLLQWFLPRLYPERLDAQPKPNHKHQTLHSHQGTPVYLIINIKCNINIRFVLPLKSSFCPLKFLRSQHLLWTYQSFPFPSRYPLRNMMF